MTGPETPDVTKAQAIAVLSTALGIATAAGAPISDELQKQIIDSVMILAPTLVAGDAWIRWSRAKHLGESLMKRGANDKPVFNKKENRSLIFGIVLSFILALAALIVSIIN